MKNLLFIYVRNFSIQLHPYRLNRPISLCERFYSTERSVSDDEKIKTDGDTTTNNISEKSDQKLIKVAVIGVPNAGKSSFINSVTNHRICPTSHKVHTTLTTSKTIHHYAQSEMILFDTPGLTTPAEKRKYKLGDSFIHSCRYAIQNSDLIAVIHDVSNSYTRNALHPTVLETLIANKEVPSILIMNKIDMVRSKRILLDLVNILTEKTLVCKQRRYLPWDGNEEKFLKDMERPVKYKNTKPAGWPYFSDVFMVSALTGDGVGRASNYIFDQSTNRPWEYPNFQFTDQSAEKLILENVRAVLLDFLPQEIPYELRCEMELFEKQANKRLVACVNIHCKSKHIEKLICGKDNGRLKQMSEVVASNIIQLYKFNVSIVLHLLSKEKSVS